MQKTRKASFSGSWYPARASECETSIREFLAETGFQTIPKADYLSGIVPHAGWYFSGSLACRVISELRGEADDPSPDVIVVFGMHMAPDSTPTIMSEGAWDTPFGEIDIAEDLARPLTEKFKFNIETPVYFTPDNTIELQLPFIKYFFPTSRLLPLGVPPSKTTLEIAEHVVKTAAQLDIKIKIIGSTDLTHYGANYGFSPAGRGKKAVDWARDENDQQVIDKMLAMDPESVIAEGLSRHNACCSGAAAAAVAAAKALGAGHAELIGYASSYDKHPGDSFVGYTGVVFR